jgi:hypothetical protein
MRLFSFLSFAVCYEPPAKAAPEYAALCRVLLRVPDSFQTGLFRSQANPQKEKTCHGIPHRRRMYYRPLGIVRLDAILAEMSEAVPEWSGES